ncbi:EAL domain-containing protein [Ideonella sp. 4Y16]|uniref:putative bifunctional diguanylate cyclase/phosphodiesterase n=1 Tax=Ideonella alba TaxID=2824118 RepID=UPI001B37C1A0|nr:EAL domain-containing protein [Ideonella alba]MBQ0943258.1 EAL domain-containing protein [Ideonella alba]
MPHPERRQPKRLLNRSVHRSPAAARPAVASVAARGAVSLRLLLMVALVAALLLPVVVLSWLAPRPAASLELLPVLAWQVGAVLLVLTAVWMLGVLRPLMRLRAAAIGLADMRGEGVQVCRPGWRPLGSELDQITRLLQQAQGRMAGLLGELEERHREMHRMAMYDALTGLPNRRMLREMFDRAAAQARRQNRPMAVLFIDLDHFKEVNDRHGHPAGDELLQTIARRLQDTLRRADLIGRLAGDEFVALLQDASDPQHLAHTTLRVIHAVEQPVPLDGGRIQGEVSASVGVARFPADGDDFDQLLDHADQAMYQAKMLGRGRFALFQPQLSPGERPIGADGEMLRAFDDDELQLFFQPVIDTETGQAVGAEALIRWQHPSEGLLPPSRIIHRAEETGALHRLELRTLDQACAQLAAWKRMGLKPGKVSINVSAPEFRHAAWAEELGQALTRHGIHRGELAVELTEGTLMGDAEDTAQRLRALRSLGVPLVIDDFGSGPISLARLGELQPAMVKLDAGFVQRLPQDVAARALVSGIVGLARSLGITVIAEGVETEAQRDMLADLGCPLQQGYLFARPQPALPEPAWPLPHAEPDLEPWPLEGANDAMLSPLDALQPNRQLGLR